MKGSRYEYIYLFAIFFSLKLHVLIVLCMKKHLWYFKYNSYVFIYFLQFCAMTNL